MPLIPLKFRPGLVRDLTEYAGGGGWYDCNWVRFRAGLPEKMGGWAQIISEQFLGVCRSLVSWTLLNGATYYGLGTNLKYYVSDTSSYTDVTPIRDTETLVDPFSVIISDTTMTVTDVAHEAVAGDFVTFSGATAFGGLSAGDINTEFQIDAVIDADTYTVTLSASPTSTATGGGAAVSAEYQINVGSDNASLGLGWGAGAWGHDTWGSDATTGVSLQLRIWSADTFGQDLITCVRNGGIYHWDADNPNDRMVALTDLPGENEAPIIATAILVSPEEFHTIAFGANPLGSTDQDPMMVRWSDTESYLEWEPTETNTAGGYRLSVGTEIVGVAHGRGQILIWTDLTLYTMTWTGPPYTFNFQQVGYNVSLIGPNASVASNDVTFWMSQNQFYIYDGRMRVLDCPLTDYVFLRLDEQQSFKTYAFSNTKFNEVGWLYQSINGSECDSYVIYNYKENAWYYGMLNRTAWLDLGATYLPLATSDDSYLYAHEFGFDDGSTNPPSAIEAYIESSPMEGPDDGPGDHYLFLSRLIPDVTFRDSSAAEPSVTMTLKAQDFPGQAVAQTYPSAVQTTSAEITRFTTQCFIRLRGRSAIFRCESTDAGVTWRLGQPRIEYRLDGRR